MEEELLFSPKFSGARFKNATLPFDVLEDLSAYQDLLIQVAKDIFYQKTGVKKVPKNFAAGVSLNLQNLKEGSTISPILIVAATFFKGGVDTKPYFLEAQNKITNIVSKAETDIDLKTDLSASALKHFRKFGKHLKDGETMYFDEKLSPNAKFTPHTRRKILLTSPEVKQVESAVDVRGSVTGYLKKPKGFIVTTYEDVQINITANEDENLEEFVKAFDRYEAEQKVLVSGTGIYNKQNKLEQVKDIKSVVLLDKKDVPTQLEKLLHFDNGWFNGEGSSYSKNEIKWLSEKFDEYFPYGILLPYTFPNPDGGVEFEWTDKNHDVTLDINLKSKHAYLHYLDTSTNEDSDDNYDLNNVDEWQRLSEYLKNYFKA